MSNSISSFFKSSLEYTCQMIRTKSGHMLRRGRGGGGGKIDKTDTFMTMNWMTKVKLKKSRLHLTLNSSVSIHADELLTNSSQEVASGFY